MDTPDTSAPETETLVIEGLPGGPVTVSGSGDNLTVAKATDAAPPPPPAEKATAEKPADDAKTSKAAEESGDEQEGGEEEEADESDAADDGSGEEEKSGEESDGDGDEEKPDAEDDDKEKEKEEGEGGDDKKAGDEEKQAEPSEADQLVEHLGGVDVLKAAQPLIEIAYDPDATPGQKYEAVKNFFGERDAFALNNEFFWGAVEEPIIQNLLAADPLAQETFAQKTLGVPFAFLQKIVGEQKELYGEDEIAAFAREHGEKKPADKKEEKKPEEKPAEFGAAFKSVIGSLNDAVEEVVTAHKLPGDKLDAFNSELAKAWGADEPAMKLMSRVRGLADSGGRYKDLLPALEKHAKRVAATVAAEVGAPAAKKVKEGQERAERVKKIAAPPPAANKPAADSAGEKKSPAAGIAARFKDGVIPDPNSDEFARFLEEDFQRRLAGG